MTKYVLADHRDHRITLHRPETAEVGAPLVITYGGQPSDLADEGFGTAFCLSEGWSTIYVSQRHGTQYQGLDIDAFSAAVLEPCVGQDVVSYGSSLGGYAAFYFGGCIDSRIIAAAPMLPAWKRLAKKAYEDVEILHSELKEVPSSSKAPVAIYDPMLRDDKLVINEMVLPAYRNLREILIPYGSHTILVTLSRARLLKPIIDALIKEDKIIEFDPPAEGTAVWHAEIGRSLKRSEPLRAMDELRKSLEIQPARQPFCVLLSLLIEQGELIEAQTLLDQARESGHKALRVVPSMTEKVLRAGLRID